MMQGSSEIVLSGNTHAYSFPRALDILVSGSCLLLLSPLFLLISLLVRSTSRGRAFYRAERIGKDGHAFRLYKFRSMKETASRIGSGITRRDDARITRVGTFLRKYKLDELPQFINVLKGEMSLVGPRPEDPRFIEFYPEHLRDILQRKPGITSPASLLMRNESALLTSDNHEQQYIDEILPAKLAIDFEYFSRATFSSDIQIILKTALSVFQREKAVSPSPPLNQ